MTTHRRIEIRRAQAGDAADIARIHIRAWQWAYRGLIPDAYLDGLSERLPQREAWRRQMLAEPKAEERTWLALLDGDVVGFADTGPSRDEDAGPGTGELYSIYINPELVGQGVGRALMSHAIDNQRSRGFGEFTLWVLDSNERARRFYESMDWKTDGSSKTDSRSGFELHEVRYRLSASSTSRRETAC